MGARGVRDWDKRAERKCGMRSRDLWWWLLVHCTVHYENPLGKRKLVRLNGDPL